MREKKQLRRGFAAILLVAVATVVAPPARAGIVGVASSSVQVYTVTEPCPACSLLPTSVNSAPDTFTPLWGAPSAAALSAATPGFGNLPGFNMTNGLGGVPITINGRDVSENLDGYTSGTGMVNGGSTPNSFGYNTSQFQFTPPTTMTQLAGLPSTDVSAYVILMSINYNVTGGVLPSQGFLPIAGTCNNNSATNAGMCMIAGGVAEYDPNGTLLGGASLSTGTRQVPANGSIVGALAPFAHINGFAGDGQLQMDAYLVLEGDPVSINLTQYQFLDGPELGPPVPEPATCVLMACGLGLLGLAGRGARTAPWDAGVSHRRAAALSVR